VLAPVPNAAITVTATAEDVELDKYGVVKTLDGRLDTAWHSGGQKIPTNVGVEVRYVFNRPVKLARVNVVNGVHPQPRRLHQQPPGQADEGAHRCRREGLEHGGQGRPADARVRRQPTTKVTFVMEDTYPGTKFKDVCISEVTFDELI
jgi:hypothetical protein